MHERTSTPRVGTQEIHREKIIDGMRRFTRVGIHLMPNQKVKRGSRATRINIAYVTRISHPLDGGSGITYEAKCERYLGIKVV